MGRKFPGHAMFLTDLISAMHSTERNRPETGGLEGKRLNNAPYRERDTQETGVLTCFDASTRIAKSEAHDYCWAIALDGEVVTNQTFRREDAERLCATYNISSELSNWGLIHEWPSRAVELIRTIAPEVTPASSHLRLFLKEYGLDDGLSFDTSVHIQAENDGWRLECCVTDSQTGEYITLDHETAHDAIEAFENGDFQTLLATLATMATEDSAPLFERAKEEGLTLNGQKISADAVYEATNTTGYRR